MPSEPRTVALGTLAAVVGVAAAYVSLAVALPACALAEPCRVAGETQAVLFVVLSFAGAVSVTGVRWAWRGW